MSKGGEEEGEQEKRRRVRGVSLSRRDEYVTLAAFAPHLSIKNLSKLSRSCLPPVTLSSLHPSLSLPFPGLEPL